MLNQTPSRVPRSSSARRTLERRRRPTARAALRDLRRRGAGRRDLRRWFERHGDSGRSWSTCTASPRPRCTSPTAPSPRPTSTPARGSVDRRADPGPARLRARRARAARARRRRRRDVRRRRRRGARLPEPPRAHRGALRRRSVPTPAARLYRTGDLARRLPRRRARVPRPHRRTGQDPRLPHRARRDRGRARAARRRARGRGPGARGRPATSASSPTSSRGDERGRAPQALRAHLAQRAARVHGARGLRARSTRCRSPPNGKLDRQALPAPEARRSRSAPTSAPRATSRRRSPRSGSELLGVDARRPRTTTSSSSAATRCSPSQARSRALRRGPATLDAARALRGARRSRELARARRAALRAGPRASATARPSAPRPRRQLPLVDARSQRRRSTASSTPCPAASPTCRLYPLAPLQEGILDRHAAAAHGDAYLLRTVVARRRRGACDASSRALQTSCSTATRSAHALPLATSAPRRCSCETARGARCPFDLGAGPRVRGCSSRSPTTMHVLLDSCTTSSPTRWSQGVLRRELRRALRRFLLRATLAAPPSSPIQYADYAAWQRRWLSRRRRALASSSPTGDGRPPRAARPPLDELPHRSAAPAGAAHRGRERGARAPARALGAALRELARREGATLFMTLLAAFDVLLAPLHRPGRHRRWARPSPAARAPRPRGSSASSSTPCVLRAATRTTPRSRALLGAVKEACLGAYAHQDMPFERLVQELAAGARPQPLAALPGDVHAPERADAPTAARRAAGGGALGSTRRGASSTSRSAWPRDGRRLAGALEYSDRSLRRGHDRADARALRACCSRRIAASPDAGLRQLPLLDREPSATRSLVELERHRARATRRTACVHELFEAQAARTPDADRARRRGRSAHLPRARRARQPARPRLRRRGVGPRSLVGVCMRALARAGGRAARRAQGGRRLRAARSRVPGGPPGLHARGRAARACPHRRRTSRPCSRAHGARR